MAYRSLGAGLRPRGILEPPGPTLVEVVRLEVEAREHERFAANLLGTGEADDAREAHEELLRALEARLACSLPVTASTGATLTRLSAAIRDAELAPEALAAVVAELGKVGS